MARRVLLIDDDRLQERIVRQYLAKLQGEGFALEWAATYEEGLTRLLGGEFAACLLDYQLGPRNGLDLLREAVAAGCRIPIVFLTAETSEKVDIEAMNAGAHDYLVKGEINPRTLERSLRYAMKLGATLEALRNLATHDQLTGLLNRREFDRVLGEEVERARRFDRSLGLILADVDHFKRINDTLGHLIGDEVLREVARRLQTQVRSVDRVMRYGGEEFAVLLMETDYQASSDVAQRIVANMAQTPVVLADQRSIEVRLSAGVAVQPIDAEDGMALVAAADKALYAAKAGGRNRAVLFRNLAER
ncbi:MAG: diguanylate cyclase [Opitutae bacterium]|nr:diguanylate cyclase [Opitutae bacterium]